MAPTPDFQNPPLTFMTALGRVESGRAQIWMRTEQPGRFLLRWWQAGQGNERQEIQVEIPEGNDRDNTACIALPAGGASPLTPLTKYFYHLADESGSRVLGKGEFETTPKEVGPMPQRFSVGIMSCNQPFDARGQVMPVSGQMLKAARDCLRRHDTKFILMMGDQMYSDFPENISLFDPAYFRNVAPSGRETIHDCTTQEVRQIFQRRYRHFWNQPDWQTMQAELPCYPIVDDHDIVDNWGSRPEHQEKKWQAIGEGARLAYFDYQGCRLWPAESPLPPSFHTSFTYGNTATFIMDLRSNRLAGDNGRLFEPQQEKDLIEFLGQHQDKRVLFFVLSVPVIHLPRFIARMMASLPHSGEDFSDRWSSGAHLKDRDRFLHLIHDHQQKNPEQKIVFLSGDIHIGCAHIIHWKTNGLPLYQFISSPITHTTPLPIQLGSKVLIRMNREIATTSGDLRGKVRLLLGTGDETRNPYGGLNLGLIEIETSSSDEEVKIRFLLYGHQDNEPVCVFRSDQF